MIHRFRPLLTVFVAALCLTSAGCPPAATAAQSAGTGLATIANLEVPRYMGTWYEIAKYPNWFQRKCVADTRADYSLLPDGTVRVLNRCRQDSGEMLEAVGAARQIGEANSPKLQVRFAPAWLSWLPVVWGDYWVIDLDPAYQLVAVSEPRQEYLWILARSPRPDAAAVEALLGRLAGKGFDLTRLERTRQGP